MPPMNGLPARPLWHAKGAGGLRCVNAATVGRSPYVAPREAVRSGRRISVLGLLPDAAPRAPGRLVGTSNELGYCGVVALTDNVTA